MEHQPEEGGPPSEKMPPRPAINPSVVLVLFVATLVVAIFYVSNQSSQRSEISYGRFRKELERDNVAEVKVQGMSKHLDALNAARAALADLL